MLFSVVGLVRSVACVSGYRKSQGSLHRRLKLLCSASVAALILADPGVAGQLPASAFQSYDASVASSIAAGPTALYTVRVNDILPTQANLGFAEIGKKVSAYDLLTPSGLANDLLTGGSIEPVVIGPGGKLYLTNGHHTFTSLQQSIYGASNPLVYVNVIANYSNLTEAEFWAKMQASNFLLPLDNGVVTPVDPLTGSPIPSALSGMTNDPYRGLEYGILKNKSSKLFPTAANVTGAVGSSIPGLDKTAAYYSDFIWANAYRNANNGLGLPYLSPGDIALATQWNLNGANVTKLQQGGTDVTVAQLPGYILSNSLNISSVIDTNTVNSGVLDGNGGFTGLRGLDLGTVTIGTPASTTGFILQLGADRGGTVTLSGNNTYAGGTTILAGTLVVSSDTNLGAASPSNPAISSIHTADDVRAANGIVFNSLSEGNGTLQINSSMTLDRPIGVGGETAIINPNGNTVTLAGMIVSLDDNANGFSDLTVAKTGGGTVVLAPTAGSNPYFYGNWIISGGTLQASSDAALGNTTGPAYIYNRPDHPRRWNLPGGRLLQFGSQPGADRQQHLRHQRVRDLVRRLAHRCATQAYRDQQQRERWRGDIRFAQYQRHEHDERHRRDLHLGLQGRGRRPYDRQPHQRRHPHRPIDTLHPANVRDVARCERIRLLRSWNIVSDQRSGSGLDDFRQRRSECLRFPDL